MAAGAILGGVGSAISGVSNLSSGIGAKNQARQAGQRAQQQQDMMNDILIGGEGGGMLGNIQQQIQNSTGNLTDIAAGGSQQLNDIANQLMGMQQPNYQFSDPSAGFNQHQFQGLDLSGLQGITDPSAGANQFQFDPLATGTSYNFQQGSNLMNQSMDAFRTQESGVRANALDQMAAQSAADVGGLDAMLAARGIGRGSGVASGALADLAGQQATQQAGLNRDLATLGSQTALQGAQFDVNRQLQEQQLGSGYNLGERQFMTGAQQQQQGMQADYLNQRQNILGGQNLQSQQLASQQALEAARLGTQYEGMQADYGLNVQNMLGGQNLQMQQLASQYGLNQAQLQQQGLGMAGDMVNAGVGNQLQAGLGVGNMFSGQLGSILSTLLGSQQLTNQQMQNAGAGFGTGMNNFAANLGDIAALFGNTNPVGNTGTNNAFSTGNVPRQINDFIMTNRMGL